MTWVKLRLVIKSHFQNNAQKIPDNLPAKNHSYRVFLFFRDQKKEIQVKICVMIENEFSVMRRTDLSKYLHFLTQHFWSMWQSEQNKMP